MNQKSNQRENHKLNQYTNRLKQWVYIRAQTCCECEYRVQTKPIFYDHTPRHTKRDAETMLEIWKSAMWMLASLGTKYKIIKNKTHSTFLKLFITPDLNLSNLQIFVILHFSINYFFTQHFKSVYI